MTELDAARNRLIVKLVYYGPALSGKTTNLTRLHDLLSPQLIGEMMTLETEGDRTRKAVLSRADGVVFVADSQKDQAANNGFSFNNRLANTEMLGMAAASLPPVIQYNKRDLQEILEEPETEINECASRQGFATLRDDAYDKVAKGLATIDEIYRVLGPE